MNVPFFSPFEQHVELKMTYINSSLLHVHFERRHQYVSLNDVLRQGAYYQSLVSHLCSP